MTQGARDVATPLSIEGMQLRQRMTYIRADNRLIAVAVPASLRDEGCSREEQEEQSNWHNDCISACVARRLLLQSSCLVQRLSLSSRFMRPSSGGLLVSGI